MLRSTQGVGYDQEISNGIRNQAYSSCLKNLIRVFLPIFVDELEHRQARAFEVVTLIDYPIHNCWISIKRNKSLLHGFEIVIEQ